MPGYRDRTADPALLKLFHPLKGGIFPDKIALRAMAALDLRLIGGALRTAEHMPDPQTDEPKRKGRGKGRILCVHKLTVIVGLHFEREPPFDETQAQRLLMF